MNFNHIDLDNWERKEYFDYYINIVKCKYNLNTNIDITELLLKVKNKKIRFYPTFIYIITKAINQNKEFRISFDKDDILGYWDYINPSYTIFHNDDKTFSDIWTEYNEDFSVFYRAAIMDLEKYKDIKGIKAKPNTPKNFCPISSIPWLSFTGYGIDTYSESKMLFPTILFGKYFKENNKVMLPFSIFVNHAVADGYHTCKLINDIQQISFNTEEWMNI
ncbi:CatA-like O-acetyltransferase [Clostridium uliginosum]|uniref:Chloramphenicol O-acetyltransferase type A n=1 Tax=Clostridium uliginosum TaxID=119641 RepID=A0A1I1QPS6_9CLOT|nr:CatA-like O-acetyltransferase [Clostridium uliginosum]SFD24101.1 chloramphenicol O-acetyltransferase type A [Clostridium uliginosum]